MYLLDALKADFSCHIISLFGGGWFDYFRSKSVSMLITYGTSEIHKDAVLQYIRTLKPVIINIHLLDPLHYIYSLGIRNYISTVHSFYTEHEMPQSGLTDRALAVSDLIITPSQLINSQINTMLNGTSPPILLIPNCVDTEKFVPQRLGPEHIDFNSCRLAYVGRLDCDKIDTQMFINTLCLLNKASISWTMDIVGDGELRDDIHASIKLNHLGRRIFFHGFQENVEKYYEGANIIFMPSLNEGLSLAALEAISMGKIVVATDVGDMSLLRKCGAIVVPKGDARKAAHAIQRIINDSQFRTHLQRQTRTLIHHYSFDRWAKQIVSNFIKAVE